MAYVAKEIRRKVEERAFQLCEYCLAFQGHSFVKFQIEHIISLKHGGMTIPENLALSCFNCNNSKGTDIGSIINDIKFVRFFNPRKDQWPDNFELTNTGIILPKTDVGETTVKILDFNNTEQLIERQELMDAGYFPHPNTVKLFMY